MNRSVRAMINRRSFLTTGLQGIALASVPSCLFSGLSWSFATDAETAQSGDITSVIRGETLFAGIRKPAKTRAELTPRVTAVEEACGGSIAGPLMLIFRFDTPVDGFDVEIGFPVSQPINDGEVMTHTLRQMHFFSSLHEGPPEKLRETTGKLYQHMNTTGLSPELEMVEVYHQHRPGMLESSQTEVMASYLAWPEVYQEQLVRVLGKESAAAIWQGGENITPYTRVDPRCVWVAASIERLKMVTTVDQQYDILSRVALLRPAEDIAMYKTMYEKTGDITTIFKAQEEQLSKTSTGGFIDPPTYDGKTLHVSKAPYNGEAYKAAKTQTEKRKACCFCALVREASDPQIDPIFCYRAAGWSRQFWEPILGVELNKCQITHSILKGDGFCAWDYKLA